MTELADRHVELRQLLTIAQVAETLQLSTRQVRRLIERKEIPAYRFGRLIRVSPGGLSGFIESRSLSSNTCKRTTQNRNKL